MKNYFNKQSIETLEEKIYINRLDYARYQSLLTLLILIPWLLILLFFKREQSWMWIVNVLACIICFGLYIWLSFRLSEKLFQKGGPEISKGDLIVFRKKYYVTIIEYVIPMILIRFIEPWIVVSVTLLFTCGRLAYMLFDLKKRNQSF